MRHKPDRAANRAVKFRSPQRKTTMLRLTEIKLPLDHEPEALSQAVCQRLEILPEAIQEITVFRRGYDARKSSAIHLVYTLDIRLSEDLDEAALLQRMAARHVQATPDMRYHFVARAPENLRERPVVVGMGPCGLFAGLLLAQMGFRPVILERGKAVRERTKDTWGLWRKGVLNPESNVQFGEGGAGTFSDGKLYSQIKDPQHLGRKVLEEFVKAGAPEEILYVSKPHIGTFRLVSMIERMREEITRLGGEIRFGSRVEGLLFDVTGITNATDATSPKHVRAVSLQDGSVLETRHLVLAVGHSARDTFAMLHQAGVFMEAKPFSIGVRIEHPQSLIDRARFGKFAGHPLLGAADYKLVHHASNGRSAYSFCMCPGGTVVAASSEPERVVTNGMSQYSRNERNANSALVVDVRPDDFFDDAQKNPLAGIDFQRHWESRAFAVGGGDYSAPAQRVGDFLAGRASTHLGEVQPSYTPGVKPANLADCLPDYVVAALREALPAFARQIRGYDLADALMTGVETRTSSPLRIRRGEDFQSVNTVGLYPAGEGAGYAGGIYSAAIDGIKVAQAVALAMAGAEAAGKT